MSTQIEQPPQQTRMRAFSWRELLGPAFLILVVLVLLGFEFRDGGIHLGALFSNGQNVLSAKSTDVETQFVPWRAFGFSQMRQGHFPLWNPHVFCGTPYAGSLQAALLYPLNWIFLFLPVGVAVNWNIGMHVMLAGIAMYCWARYRGVSRVGATLGGMTYMLSGQYFLHIMPGHLPWLCVTAWTPLVMMVCDGLLDEGTKARKHEGTKGKTSSVSFASYAPWILFGAFLTAMQILCGYPQPVYIEVLIASLYLALNVFVSPLLDQWIRRQKNTFDARHAMRVFVSWFGIWIIGALISAVWLGAGISTQAESGRAGGTPFEFASTYYLPWQNLITMLVPNFWGGTHPSRPYTSEWLAWEMIVFIGAAAFGLAIYSAFAGKAKNRRFAFGLIIFCILLSLGIQTPLYRIMFDLVPGFSRFRGSSKWAWMATALLSLMTAMGWDLLRQAPKRAWIVASILAVLGISIGIFGYEINHSDVWSQICVWTDSQSTESVKVPPNPTAEQIEMLNRVMQAKAQVVSHPFFSKPQFVKDTGIYAAKQCGYAMGACLIAAAFFLATRFNRGASWGIAILLVVETTLWAHSTYVTTPTFPQWPDNWLEQKDRLAKNDERALIIPPEYQNLGMNVGINSVWGYDPVMTRRYAQLMGAMQGFDPDQVVDSSIGFRTFPSILSMLRCRCGFFIDPTQHAIMADLPAPMPRFNFIGEYRVISTRDESFQTMARPGFYPRSEVLLESEPDVKPAGGDGEVKILGETTDEVELEVSVPKPTILLVTDAYSNGWRARALSGSVQSEYSVMPANWILRAIPLQAGKHHFVMEYLPREYVVGKWISIVALPVYLGAVFFVIAKKRRKTV